MSRVNKCDCCGLTDSEVRVDYSFKKRWNWFLRQFSLEGGYWQRLDVCEKCWNKIGEMVRKEVKK